MTPDNQIPENIFEEAPETLRMLVKEINSPNLGVCFDTGHFNLFSKVPLEKWFEEIGDNIIEVHLHDNTGSNDDHLGIGDGNIDFDLFFSLLKNSPLANDKNILRSQDHLL